MKKIFTLFLLMLTICTTAQAAGGSTFYYKFVVQPNETGAGKVYASNKELDPETVSYKDYYGTSVFSEGSLPNVKTVTVTAYLYAQPEDGYMFTHWARVENNKETIFSNARHTSDLVTSTHTDKTDPQVTRYKAYFAKYGVAYPVSSDETLGTVSIDIPTNQIGDDITMTANPDPLSGRFKGWRRNNQTTLITDNPLSFKVSNANKGVYTAIFEPSGVDDEGIFVLMQDVGTKRFFGVCGNSEGTFNEDQRYFLNSMMLVDENNSEIRNTPAFLLNITGTPNGMGGLNNVAISSQGISTYDISDQHFQMENFEKDEYFIFASHNGFTGYLKDNGYADTGKRQMERIGSCHSPGIWNRWNYNRDYAWRFHIVDEEHFDTNYIGAKADASTLKDGKYYTTMYTPFAYECRDGMKAYTVDKFTSEGEVHLKEVRNGKVPAFTAVLLECNGTTPRENRMMPITETLEPIETNLLKGEIWLNDESGDPANYRTAFNPATMRILSKNATFGKENLTDPTNNNAPLTYIANNTCYLDVSGVDAADDITTTKIGDDINKLWGDVDGNGIVNVTDVMLIIDNILGKPTPVFIYINADTDESNSINVTDAMLIVDYILGKL